MENYNNKLNEKKEYEILVEELLRELEYNNIEINNDLMSDVYEFVNVFRMSNISAFFKFEQVKQSLPSLIELAKEIYNYTEHITDEKEIAERIFSNYFENGYSFHLTNGYNAKKIAQTGIGPEYKRADTLELTNLINQFSDYAQKALFMYARNDTKTISYSGKPLFRSEYGKTPEWFLEFSSRSYNKEDDRELALEKALMASEYALTEEDKKIYITNFTKYWDLFNNEDRKLIMLPNNQIYDINEIKRAIFEGANPLEVVIYAACKYSSELDLTTEANISHDKLIITDVYKPYMNNKAKSR